MRCPDIPMPPQIQRLPQDARGYPVPFMLDRGDGTTDFKTLTTNGATCIVSRLCGICGGPLGYWLVFVGGPGSCSTRTFTNPPFHPSCADYAGKVCPYILYGGWDRTKYRDAEERIAENPAVSLAKVATFRYLTRGYHLRRIGDVGIVLVAHKAKEITRLSPEEPEL